jgi:hypothetical protein
MRKNFLFICIMAIFSGSFAVDYSKKENWAALPGMNDNADWVPEGSDLENLQDSATADVFFIHPTTDVTGYSGNATIDDKAVNKRTDELSMKYQASVFNGSCRVYAPRYRQAVLNNFFTRNSEKSKKAFDLAYQDVREAFEYYLKHYNNGRPIIIAGHSQGSMHAARLLADFFDGTPLQKQLVEAYLIGYPVHENQFRIVKVSNAPDATGGYVSYCTFGMGADIVSFLPEYRNAVVVNPLNWSTDKTFVSADYHAGGLSRKWNGIRAKLCGAKCGNGILEIQKPVESGFTPLAFKNYHMYDYPLFYMNIRENVALRVRSFAARNDAK